MITCAIPGNITRLRANNRAATARERVRLARRALADCRFCAHRCGVNRLAGEQGICRAGTEARVFSAQTEVTDELELVPVLAIALSGCDLRCNFCVTGADSWNVRRGAVIDVAALAARAEDALARGARNIMILGGEPTIHLATVLEIVAALPDHARLVWKTNAHGSAEARALLEGLFDVWVADYKFGSDACGLRLARIEDYTAPVRENLLWAEEHAELIVRHLLMPGHVDCCWHPVAQWLGQYLPGVKVNLRCSYWPAWQAARHPELGGVLTATEAKRALDIARECALYLIP